MIMFNVFNELEKDITTIINELKPNEKFNNDFDSFREELKKVIIKKLIELNYVKLPPESSIWTKEEQITICKNSIKLESRNILQILYNFMKQNKLLDSKNYEIIISFIKETFGLYIN